MNGSHLEKQIGKNSTLTKPIHNLRQPASTLAAGSTLDAQTHKQINHCTVGDEKEGGEGGCPEVLGGKQ